jgi:peptide/nickel transport system permease protein
MTDTVTAEALLDQPMPTRPAGVWRDTLGSILRQRSAVVGLTLLILLIALAIFAPVIATHDPNLTLLGIEEGVQRRSAPCIHALGCAADQPQHLFGTDGNVRDVFSRVVYGTRTSLTLGFAAIAFAIVIGTTIGAISGFIGGWTDNVLMRLMDVILAFPSLLLAIAIVTAVGRSLVNALLAIGIVSIPIYARVARSAVLTTRESDFVTASRALGESSIGILARRILPNSLTPLVVQGTLGIGGAVLEIAALAFVGVTGDLSNPEWGSMIGLERNQLFNAPHIILAPGLAITLTVLAFNLLGDGLRDALDPRLNR